MLYHMSHGALCRELWNVSCHVPRHVTELASVSRGVTDHACCSPRCLRRSASFSCSSEIMTDFTPVPAGTPAAAALVLRGPDPDILSVAGTNFQVMVSANCGERVGPVANQRLGLLTPRLAGSFASRSSIVTSRCLTGRRTALPLTPRSLRRTWSSW